METQLPSTPSLPCCSLKSKLLCFSAGSLVLLLVAILSFFFGRASVKPSPLSQVMPTPTAAETVYTEDSRSANWKTYTNNNLRFSLRYPSDLILSESNEGISLDEKNAVERNLPIINVNIKIIEASFEDWIKTEYAKRCPADFDSCTPLARAKIYSIKAYQFFTKNRHYVSVTTYLNKGNRVFVFDMSAREPNRQFNESENHLYGQILSTFKFLE